MGYYGDQLSGSCHSWGWEGGRNTEAERVRIRKGGREARLRETETGKERHREGTGEAGEEKVRTETDIEAEGESERIERLRQMTPPL